jgi:hypothetical protein
MSSVTVRPATTEDLHELHYRLHEQREYFEQQDLSKAIVFIAEYEGQIVGFAAGRLIWQVEPLLLTPEFKKEHAHSQRKATFLLIRELDRWIGDRARNLSGIHSYFCSIRGRTMQKLAVSFGMLSIYRRCKFFGRDT